MRMQLVHARSGREGGEGVSEHRQHHLRACCGGVGSLPAQQQRSRKGSQSMLQSKSPCGASAHSGGGPEAYKPLMTRPKPPLMQHQTTANIIHGSPPLRSHCCSISEIVAASLYWSRCPSTEAVVACWPKSTPHDCLLCAENGHPSKK